MGKVAAVIIVHQPVHVVWNYISDLHRTPEWVVGLEAVENITPGQTRVGTRYTDIMRAGPSRQVTTWEVTELVPLSHQVHVSESAVLPSTLTMIVTPIKEGTLFQQVIEYRFLPRLGLVSRLIEALVLNRLLGLSVNAIVRNMKRQVEGESSAVLVRVPA